MTALRAAFLEQARHCTGLDSPFMARLMTLAATHWPLDDRVAGQFADWEGEIGPKGASLPLRWAGALHALVLSGRAPGLAAVYPPQTCTDAALLGAIRSAMEQEAAFVGAWVQSAPQTNELRRAATLLPVAAWLAHRFPDAPLILSELGASGGLNLLFDRFALDVAGVTLGAVNSSLRLAPEWRGDAPIVAPITVVERCGVDINPLDPRSEGDALRLLAYLWPDQPDRMRRTKAAIALAHETAPQVAAADAALWLKARLGAEMHPQAPVIHLVYHTIAWQYFPAQSQAQAREALEAAGARATQDRPLAWFGMEADSNSPGAAMTLRLWPGDHRFDLRRADFHGRWVDWRTPKPM